MTSTNPPVAVTPPVPTSRLRRWGAGLKTALREGWPTLIFDMLGPIAVYQVLVSQGMGEVPALVWSAFPPLFIVIIEGIKEKKVNGVGAIVLVSIALALVMYLFGGSPQQVVARDAYGNTVLGLALLVTLLVGRRPLMYYLLRIPGEDFLPGLRDSFAIQWEQNRFFRSYIRNCSIVCGSILILEAICRFICAYTLPIEVTLAIFQVEGFVLWTALLWPLIAGYRWSTRRWNEERAEAGLPPFEGAIADAVAQGSTPEPAGGSS